MSACNLQRPHCKRCAGPNPGPRTGEELARAASLLAHRPCVSGAEGSAGGLWPWLVPSGPSLVPAPWNGLGRGWGASLRETFPDFRAPAQWPQGSSLYGQVQPHTESQAVPRGTVVRGSGSALSPNLLITASLHLRVLASKMEIIMSATHAGLGLGDHRGAEKNCQAVAQLCGLPVRPCGGH